MAVRRLLWLWLLLLLDARAYALTLGFPLQCTVGVDCWIANYVDHDPAGGSTDHRCGSRTYDAHTGIDIAIRDLAQMDHGVNVLAASAGTVLRVRSGEPDGLNEALRRRAVELGRECGNGVVLDHGDGWTTQYCHLRRGSVRVSVNDRVASGDVLGQVGTSGSSEFPHVHLTVKQRDAIVDPYTGAAATAPCGSESATALWKEDIREALTYRSGDVFHIGIAGSSPDLHQVRRGTLDHSSLACDSPGLVLWMEAFGARQGDRLEYELIGPDGVAVVRGHESIEKTQARIFRYVGKKRRAACWPVGRYTGAYRMISNSRVISELKSWVDVVAP